MVIDFRERRGGRERETRKNINQFASCTEDQTPNLGMCPDQGSNPQPFGVGITLQQTEPPSQGPSS